MPTVTPHAIPRAPHSAHGGHAEAMVARQRTFPAPCALLAVAPRSGFAGRGRPRRCRREPEAEIRASAVGGGRWRGSAGPREGKRFLERFETESLALMPGQKVQARGLSHQPWGVLVEIVGYENAGLSASIDMIQQFSRTTSSHDELLALFSTHRFTDRCNDRANPPLASAGISAAHHPTCRPEVAGLELRLLW